MSSDRSLAILFAQIANAFAAYAKALGDAEHLHEAENPHVRPVVEPRIEPIWTATPAPVVAPEPHPTPQLAPQSMTQTDFIAAATAILQRHGGDQAPLGPLMAAWGVAQPANELPPGQFPAFLSQMRQAYGEAV